LPKFDNFCVERIKMEADERLPAGLVLQTVLVVESDVLVRMAISQYLRDCDLKVIEAANADEAVIVLQEPDLAVDVILSNAQMPGPISGFGLSHWVKDHRSDIPVILVGTANGAAKAAEELCEAGPIQTKPYDSQRLVSRIRQLLAERKVSSNGNGRGKAKLRLRKVG
jgi:DNA-binding NtrC family response regulator